MEKKQVGRPKVERPKDKQVSFRLTEKQYKRLQEIAKEVEGSGSVSLFLRGLTERVLAGSAEVWGSGQHIHTSDAELNKGYSQVFNGKS